MVKAIELLMMKIKMKINLIMTLRVIAVKSVKVSGGLEHINVPVLHQI